MRIVIAATDSQWEEWPAGDKNTEWVRVADANAFAENMDAEGFFLTPEKLREKYQKELGNFQNENVIVHCFKPLVQSGC